MQLMLDDTNRHRFCLASHFSDIGKYCIPKSDAASEQGLHCLHTGISIKNKIKMKKFTRHPLKKNGIVQLIRMGKSTWRKRG